MRDYEAVYLVDTDCLLTTFLLSFATTPPTPTASFRLKVSYCSLLCPHVIGIVLVNATVTAESPWTHFVFSVSRPMIRLLLKE